MKNEMGDITNLVVKLLQKLIESILFSNYLEEGQQMQVETLEINQKWRIIADMKIEQ